MGISQDNWRKACKTWGWRGSKRKAYHKEPKHELGRPAAYTKIAPTHTHPPHTLSECGALSLGVGNFSRGSEGCTCKIKIIDVVYNASHYKADRTKTLVKTCIVLIDSTLYPQRSECH